jgi:hypothetical protein
MRLGICPAHRRLEIYAIHVVVLGKMVRQLSYLACVLAQSIFGAGPALFAYLSPRGLVFGGFDFA